MESRPLPPDQLLAQVWSFIQARDIQSAVKACQAMNMHYPDNPNGWYAGSFLASQLGGYDHALQSIDRALSLQPGNQRWILHKTGCLHAIGELVKANEMINSVAQTAHTDTRLYGEIGLLASRFGEHALALKMFRIAIEHYPDEGRLHFNLATEYRFQGEPENAEAACNRALELDSRDYDALFLRSGLRRQTSDNNHVTELEAALQDAETNSLGQAQVCYSLAKELEDLGESTRSFEALNRGAKARRSSLNYDVNEDIQFLHSLAAVYDQQFLSQNQSGYENNEAIFVLGLPRTGTTLVERILSSHDAVISRGELTHFTRIIAGMAQMISQQNPSINIASRSDMVQLTSKINFAQLGKAYLDSARPQYSGKARHFIDKFPPNTLNIGPITLALPQAKIIMLDRHPMDSCYSMFKQLFTEIYHFSYDLKELGQYFIAHQQLLNHWLEVAGSAIHVVRYETLVQNPELEIRKLLEFCELPWQEQCLNFHQNPQVSTTASASQVRQKIYTSSIGKWKDYEQQLEPLRKMLADAGCLEGY